MSWYSKMQDKLRKKFVKDCEDLAYTAQKGSTLDRIWNTPLITLPKENIEIVDNQSEDNPDKYTFQYTDKSGVSHKKIFYCNLKSFNHISELEKWQKKLLF